MEKNEYEVLQDKLAQGESLTDEEMQTVMSQPNAEPDPMQQESIDDSFDEDETKDIPEEEPEDKESSASSKTDEESSPEPDGEKKEEVKPPEDQTQEGETSEESTKAEVISLDKVQQELDKPAGSEDLDQFSSREKALFWEMRRERRSRQKAEEERDALRFKELKRTAQEQTQKKEEDDQEKHDPEDFITFGDFEKLKGSKPLAPTPSLLDERIKSQYLVMCEEKAKIIYDDFDEVIECANDILSNNEQYQKQVLDAFGRGDNPAITMYHLIKGDPQFEKVIPIARAQLQSKGHKNVTNNPDTDKKEEAAKRAEDQMQKNQQKPRTSSHFSSEDAGREEAGYTLEKLARMSDAEFAAIPKDKRDKLLKKFGG